MHALLGSLLLFFAVPYWETNPPEKWSLREIELLRVSSPWAQTVGPEPRVLAYLATAAPIEQAEGELRLRSRQALKQLDPDYLTYLSENRETHFVLAIPYPERARLGNAEEQRRLENETLMLIGRKEYHISGHFPPTPSDPVLRIIFPRQVRETDKKVVFRLYLPGINFPDRELEFTVKDLMYHGRLQM